MNKGTKAYIDKAAQELITIGWHPEWAADQCQKLGLKRWGWIDEKDDRPIPNSWTTVYLKCDEASK
jgi:hypothetical protein